ncbi:MAG: hypothetical protein OXI19_07450 [Gemmatimonadota bacterium]|nr:hypothetical protein [Gemmatimonadota bacterium]
MKRVILFAASIVLLACLQPDTAVGPRGLTGPQGEKGDPGEPGRDYPYSQLAMSGVISIQSDPLRGSATRHPYRMSGATAEQLRRGQWVVAAFDPPEAGRYVSAHTTEFDPGLLQITVVAPENVQFRFMVMWYDVSSGISRVKWIQVNPSVAS